MRHWWKFLAGGVFLILLVVGLSRLDWEGIVLPLIDSIEQLGFWGPLLFILLYMVATVILFPPSILSMGAGAIFGFWKGAVYVLVGANLGATAAFLIGRFFARDWLASKIKSKPKLRAIDKAVAEEGWRIVLLMRLSPIFPFKLLNYAFGLTRVSLTGYVVASVVGNTPGALAWVYSGTLARWGFLGEERTAGQWALYSTGFLATVGLAFYFSWISRKALKEKIEEEEEEEGG